MATIFKSKKKKYVPTKTIANRDTMPTVSQMRHNAIANSGTLIVKLPDIFVSTGILEEFIRRIIIVSQTNECKNIMLLANHFGTSRRVVLDQIPQNLDCTVEFTIGHAPEGGFQTVGVHYITTKRMPTFGIVCVLENQENCRVIRWR